MSVGYPAAVFASVSEGNRYYLLFSKITRLTTQQSGSALNDFLN
jgi:hypothetical protein